MFERRVGTTSLAEALEYAPAQAAPGKQTRAESHDTARVEQAQPRPSTARAGRVINVSLGALVDGTTLTPGLVRLVRAMQRDGLRIGDRVIGLDKLAAVFAAPANQARLKQLTRSSNPSAWLRGRTTAVMLTRDRVAGVLVPRSAGEIVQRLVKYLEAHPGAKVLLDELGQHRFDLIRDVARELSKPMYRGLRGRWGTYVSAGPGGIQNNTHLRGALSALRGAGASAVLEGYKFGVNRWQDRDERLAEGARSIALLRQYFARPGYAVGADAKRVGIDFEKHTLDGKKTKLARPQLQRIFLSRLSQVLRAAPPAVDRGSWVSRLEGNASADARELDALLG